MIISTLVFSLVVVCNYTAINASKRDLSPPSNPIGGSRPRIMESTSGAGGSGNELGGSGLGGGISSNDSAHGSHRGQVRGESISTRASRNDRHIPVNPIGPYIPHNPVTEEDPPPEYTFLILNRRVGVWKDPGTRRVTWVQPVLGENIVPDSRSYKLTHNYMTKYALLPRKVWARLYISDQFKLLGVTRLPDPARNNPEPGIFYITFQKSTIRVKYNTQTKVIMEFGFMPRNYLPTVGSRSSERLAFRTASFCDIHFTIAYEPEEPGADEHMWSANIDPAVQQLVYWDEYLEPKP